MTALLDEKRVGPWVQPVNHWQNAPNSIHNDTRARELGLRGGTIPGPRHLDNFRSLLDELFGDRWLINGAISMYYTYATTHLEDVRAVIKAPPGRCWDETAKFPAWVETPDQKIVCKGTVSIGPTATPNYVRSLPMESPREGQNRIVKMRPGDELPRIEGFHLKGGEDGVLRNPQEMFVALSIPSRPPRITEPAVAFFGGTEIQLRHGPIRTGTAYVKTGRVASVGVTEKTEFAWIDTELTDEAGRVIADMRHMDRWMKASSPLWKT